MYSIWRNKKTNKLKAIALFLTIIFVVEQCSFANTQIVNNTIYAIENSIAGNFAISNALGDIVQKHIKPSTKTIISIQDSHASLSVQNSITKILNNLTNKYDINFIGVEGSYGNIDTSILKTCPDQQIKEATVNQLISEGLMSSAEGFSITEKKEIELFGIDNNEFYNKNVDIVKEFLNDIDYSVNILDKIKHTLTESIKDKNQKNSKFIDIIETIFLYRKNKIGFSQYWNTIQKSFIKTKEYKTAHELHEILECIEIEQKVSFEKADIQRKKLIQDIVASLSESSARELTDKTVLFKKNDLSEKEYYKYVLNIAKTKNILIDSYPAFNQYYQYFNKYKLVDFVQFQKEIRDIENSIIKNIIKNNNFETLYYLHQIGFLFSLNIDSTEVNVLNKKSKEDLFQRIDLLCKNRLIKNMGLKQLKEKIRLGLSFYDIVEKRNTFMVNNLLTQMNNKELDIAVIVTGGYHTEDMMKSVGQKDFSYVVIAPNVKQEKKRPYITILTQKKAKNFSGTSNHLAVSQYFATGNLTMLMEAFMYPLIRINEKEGKEKASIFKNKWKKAYENQYNKQNKNQKISIFKVEPEVFNKVIDSITHETIEELGKYTGDQCKQKMLEIYEDVLSKYQNSKYEKRLSNGVLLDCHNISEVISSYMFRALRDVFEKNDFYINLKLAPEDVEKVFVEKVLNFEKGRDSFSVYLFLKKTDKPKQIQVSLYKNGYNLSGKIEDRYFRVANRILIAYKNFNFDPYENVLLEQEIRSSDIKQSVEESFKKELKTTILKSIEGIDGSKTVYCDKEDEYIVKEITEEEKASYIKAEERLGHLAVRFILTNDLVVNVEEASGNVLTKVIKRAVIQKRVHRFFTRDRKDKQKKYKGVLADAIHSGDFETAKMFMNSFFGNIKSMLIRDLLIYKDLNDAYGYDASVGTVGPVEMQNIINLYEDETKMSSALEEFIVNIFKFKKNLCDWIIYCAESENGSFLKPKEKNLYTEDLLEHFDKGFMSLFELDFAETDLLNLKGNNFNEKAANIMINQEIIESYKKNRFLDELYMSVYYVGPTSVQLKAEQILSSKIKAQGIKVGKIEKVLAEIGFARATEMDNKMQFIRNIFYMKTKISPYIGVKIRRIKKNIITVSRVIMDRKHEGFNVKDEAVLTLKKEVAKILFTVYDYSIDRYKMLAQRFELDANININNKIALYTEVNKLRNRSFTSEEKEFLKDFVSLDNMEDVPASLMLCFEKLKERRRYPLEIDLAGFLVHKTHSGLRPSLYGFGGYVPKVVENMVVQHMFDNLFIDYDTIFEALIELWGARQASYFLEKVYFQEPKESELKKYTARCLNDLYELKIPSPITARLVRKRSAGRLDRFYQPTKVFDEGDLHESQKGRIDRSADIRSFDLKQIFYEYPNIVVFDNSNSDLQGERSTIVKNWTNLVEEDNFKSNIILVNNLTEENILIKGERIFIKKGYVFLMGNFVKLTFDEPVEVHYAYGKHLLGRRRINKDIDLRGPPSEATMNIRYSLESQKTGQIEIAKNIKVPTKEVLATLGYSGDDYGFKEEILKEINDIVKKGIDKIYVQPTRGTRKYLSGVFSLKTEEERQELCDFLIVWGGRYYFLLLNYIPSIDLVYQDQTLNNDIRAIVTRCSNGTFKVSPIRLYVSKEEKGEISGTEKQGTIMTDVTCMPVNEAMNYCLINDEYLTHEQGQLVIAKITEHSTTMAKELYKRGYKFDVMAMDFIISDKRDENGIPIVHFIECASHFAGEYDWDNVGEKGSYRKNLYDTAVKSAMTHKEKMDSEKSPVIIGIITNDEKEVEKLNKKIAYTGIVFVRVDGDAKDVVFFNKKVQQSGAYISAICDFTKSTLKKNKETISEITEKMREEKIKEFNTMSDYYNLEQGLVEIKKEMEDLLNGLDTITSFNISDIKIYEYKFDYLQQRENVEIENLMIDKNGDQKEQVVLMQANNLAELRWIAQEHSKARKKHGESYNVSLHIKLNDINVNQQNIIKTLEALGLSEIISVNDISFKEKSMENIIKYLQNKHQGLSLEDIAIGMHEKDIEDNKDYYEKIAEKGVFVASMQEGFVFNFYSVLSALLIMDDEDSLFSQLSSYCKMEKIAKRFFTFKFIVPYNMEKLRKEIDLYEKIIIST